MVLVWFIIYRMLPHTVPPYSPLYCKNKHAFNKDLI